MEHLRNLKIAIDFDGTLVEHQYPKIGRDILFSFETLRELQKHGALLILWTFRAGKDLDEAVDYCKNKGIDFYAINKNYPEEIYDDSISRKVNADIFIDDKNVGGFRGWSNIWQDLSLYDLREREAEKFLNRGPSLFSRIFNRRKKERDEF